MKRRAVGKAWTVIDQESRSAVDLSQCARILLQQSNLLPRGQESDSQVAAVLFTDLPPAIIVLPDPLIGNELSFRGDFRA